MKNGIPLEGLLEIYLEFASIGHLDSHLNVTIVVIICVYRMNLKTILIAWKYAKPKPGVFRFIPSMGKIRWLRIFAIFGKGILTKPHELK